jgi:hypothetical protein
VLLGLCVEQYATDLADIDYAQANLLADLAGWVVQNNEDHFKDLRGLSIVRDQEKLVSLQV